MEPITDEEDVKYYLGRLYFENKGYKKAIKIYKQGLKINPKSVILLYEIGLAYLKLRNHKKALRYWRKLLKIAPHRFLAVKIKEEILGKEKILDSFF
jgi:tetratricopeptide (TPR) repeat protein